MAGEFNKGLVMPKVLAAAICRGNLSGWSKHVSLNLPTAAVEEVVQLSMAVTTKKKITVNIATDNYLKRA